jgi:hypothetical protein
MPFLQIATARSLPDENPSTTLPVSTAFHPELVVGDRPPDIRFLAGDVYFYAHLAEVLEHSSNNLNYLIPQPLEPSSQVSGELLTVAVFDQPAVFNIILHTIYGWSCAAFGPSINDIFAAVRALHTYGVSLSICIAPDTPLWTLILNYTPLYPIEIYALAGSYNLEQLAARVSSQLLSVNILSLSDELVAQMTARYLHRLVSLQTARMEKLKELVLTPPEGHIPSATCSYAQQKDMTGSWALASAELSWIARPGMCVYFKPPDVY